MNVCKYANGMDEADQERMFVKCTISNLTMRALLDGGSNISFGGLFLFNHLQQQDVQMTTRQRMIAFSDEKPVNYLTHNAKVNVVIQEKSFEISLVVIPVHNTTKLILGCDFLRIARVNANYETKNWTFKDSEGQVVAIIPHPEPIEVHQGPKPGAKLANEQVLQDVQRDLQAVKAYSQQQAQELLDSHILIHRLEETNKQLGREKVILEGACKLKVRKLEKRLRDVESVLEKNIFGPGVQPNVVEQEPGPNVQPDVVEQESGPRVQPVVVEQESGPLVQPVVVEQEPADQVQIIPTIRRDRSPDSPGERKKVKWGSITVWNPSRHSGL